MAVILDPPVKVLVLNLEKDKGRLTDVTIQFDSAGVSFERVDGLFDPKLFSEASNSAIYDNNANVNCTRGHVKCLIHASKAAEEFALICEDDFRIIDPTKFAKKLKKAIATLSESEGDVLQIGWLPRGSSMKIVQRNYYLARTINILENILRWAPVKLGLLKEGKDFSSGGHMYLVRTKKTNELAMYLERNFHIPIDWIYRQLSREPQNQCLPRVLKYRYNLAIQSNKYRSNVDHRS